MKKILSILFIALMFYLLASSNINSVFGTTVSVKYIDDPAVNEPKIYTVIDSDKDTNYNIEVNNDLKDNKEEVKTQEYYDKKYKKDMFVYKIILSFLIVGESLVITLVQSKRRYKIITKTFYD